uniref:Uncharacterized protein n=1 Tax=Arundo donax TaxID=35708 RepID=A0A0A9BXC3_ARUDO
MQFDYVVNKNLGYSLDSIWVGQWNEMGILCKSINNDQNYLFSLRFRKAFNKIHGELRPCHIWDR